MRDEYNAELAVIGSMLLDPDCAAAMLDKLAVEDFENIYAREVLTVMKRLAEEGRPLDAVLTVEEIGDQTVRQWMLRAMEVVVTTANADEYAKIVKRNAKLRKLHAIGDNLAMSGLDYRAEAIKSIEDIENIVEDTTSADAVGAGEWANEFMEQQERIIADPTSAFCRTGYTDIDRVLGGGMFNGGLYVLAARPGMGKTTFALNIAEKVAKRNDAVLMVSLEMDGREIMCKRIAAEQDIPYKALMSGYVDDVSAARMRKCVERIKDRPFSVNRAAAMTITDITVLAKSIKGLRLVVIDYFGLIAVEGQEHDRYNDYTTISGKLKRMARRLDVPVLCLAQLNRNTESRTNKKPQLADLRDTGALEQDADGVIFLHRQSYYSEDERPETEGIDVIIAKNRHGETGTTTLWWNGAFGQIAEMYRGPDTTPDNYFGLEEL